jgi:dTDP-4-dehydrorhamnose reductase
VTVLVLGAGGMAGHIVSIYLKERGYDVDTLSAHNKITDDTLLVDVTDAQALRRVLEQKSYDVVVNCIGVLIQGSEQRKDISTYLNSYLPHFLEKYYEESKTKVIHLSTDCVFSGKNGPYVESSPYDGELFYDRSKALGEIINDKDLTFRMSIIGPDTQQAGVGLFNWFYSQSGEINGFTKSVWNGITTIELARGIDQAIQQNLTGLYHLVPADNITKHDLLKLFAKIFNRSSLTIKPIEGENTNKTLINTRTDFDFQVKSYHEMVTDMRAWITNHKSLYPHYE